jgi:hypothetical protein
MVFLFVLCSASCSKDHTGSVISRQIKFVLYTDQDFSGVKDNILFSVFIKANGITLFDSSLAPMRVQDIPGFAHKIVIEKRVPNNDQSLLSVGFNYTIENIGSSWYKDTCASGELSKTVLFSFR